MEKGTPVTRALTALGIPHRLHLHETPLRSLEQAALERELEPGQIVRTLVFRLGEGSYVLVLMPGPGHVDWPKLRRHLGVTRLTTASAEEVLTITGYTAGAVSPFGLPQPLRILADVGIRRYDVLSLGAGVRNAGVILKRDDLLRVLKPELGDFSAS